MDGFGRIADTPILFIKQSMVCGDYPKIGSPAYEKLDFVYDRLRKYDEDIGSAIDDLYDVTEWLREEKLYKQSDRLRTISHRLAMARRVYNEDNPDLIRNLARGWK